MSKNSYAETIDSAKVMIAGLQQYADRMAKRGITAEFVGNMNAKLNSAIEMNNVQEDLKAKLKTQTAGLDTEMDGLKDMLSESKKTVKIEMEQETWRSFGIEDSK